MYCHKVKIQSEILKTISSLLNVLYEKTIVPTFENFWRIYLLLLLYFKSIGGYKPVTIEEQKE